MGVSIWVTGDPQKGEHKIHLSDTCGAVFNSFIRLVYSPIAITDRMDKWMEEDMVWMVSKMAEDKS